MASDMKLQRIYRFNRFIGYPLLRGIPHCVLSHASQGRQLSRQTNSRTTSGIKPEAFLVKAFDAKTGTLLWSYDPAVPRALGVRGCCDVVNRGVAAWNGKIFVGTFDGRLVALDARSGRPVWSTLTVDSSKPYTITQAPRVIKGRVVIGNSGSEYGVRGYISAYDAETGKLAWRFYTVPGDPSQPPEDPILVEAAKTWQGDRPAAVTERPVILNTGR
jgi:outer membrane protein assembly factor BamB